MININREGWMDGWMDGWMRQLCLFLPSFTHSLHFTFIKCQLYSGARLTSYFEMGKVFFPTLLYYVCSI